MIKNHHKVLSFKYTGKEQEVFLPKGDFLFEAWGSAGIHSICKNTYSRGGRGAYVSGYLTLKETKNFFVYVGSNYGITGETFNGNKALVNAMPGGGATDFRLAKGEK